MNNAPRAPWWRQYLARRPDERYRAYENRIITYILLALVFLFASACTYYGRQIWQRTHKQEAVSAKEEAAAIQSRWESAARARMEVWR